MMSLRKKILVLLIFFIVMIITTISLALSNGNTSFSFINTTEVVDRIRATEKLGGNIELQDNDLNSILGVYVGKGRNSGGVSIKSVNVTFDEGNLSFKIPIIYKGIHLLISTSGKCTYLKAENKIEYEASYYKLGSLPFPKSIVESILKKHQSKDFEVTDSSIKTSISMLPFSIKEVFFNKNSLILSLNINNPFATLFPKLPSSVAKATESSTPKVASLVPTEPTSANAEVKQPDNSGTSTTSEEAKNSLGQISGQLSNASSSLESDNEKQILQIIMKTVSSVSSNPTYNYAPDIAKVSSLYKILPPKGKSRVKLAIMANVDLNTAMKLKTTFGL